MMKAIALALSLGLAAGAALAQTPAPADHAGMNHGAGGAMNMAIPSTPADGSTVQGSPPSLTLNFPHPMRLAAFRLMNDLGETVDVGFKPGTSVIQVAAVALPKLAPGGYEARWEGAAEGHTMGGTVKFSVK